MSTVAKLIADKNANDRKKRKVAGSNHKIRIALAAKANKVLPIMNSVERASIAARVTELNAHAIYNCPPVISMIGEPVHASSDGELVKLKTVNNYCGGTEVRTVKIPLVYFDMTNSEIEAAHIAWTKTRLDKLIKDRNARLIRIKSEQIDLLRSEIKKLKSYTI